MYAIFIGDTRAGKNNFFYFKSGGGAICENQAKALLIANIDGACACAYAPYGYFNLFPRSQAPAWECYD
ncbi:hypothetical protein PL8927_140227 [Planktothrix serta PCC 8927]|uniref:Uncharacterized protein n=1 Tax=Planktothrix serta PCC 8927 TaxID=671068 RepID=A0A7Z9BFF9_9CYAN|nr:hypothetical protein PL8927_140227 [Planktothrix serta PCC 8927]